LANYQLLDPQHHAETRILERDALLQLDRGLLCAAFTGEFRAMATVFPIVLIKDANTGRFYCAALLGLSPENLACFDHEGRWNDVYLPWSLKRQPLLIANKEGQDGGTTPMVSIDLDHPLVSTLDGKPIFEVGETLSSTTEEKMTALRSIHANVSTTESFINTLLKLKLLTGIKIKGTSRSGEPIVVDDIYGIDEDALRQLDSDTLGRLHREGQLELIFLMVASLGRVSAFTRQLNRL
jgi:hypothetical protein